MTAARFYSNAPATTIPGGCTDSATSITVGSITGFPVSYPYTLIFDPDTALEEVVTVTGGTGVNLTVTRGSDGTSGLAHSVGAAVIHGVSAREFRELQEHIGASSGIHGLTGAAVGTTDTQTLSAKTLTAPVIADFTSAQHDHNDAGRGGKIPSSAVTGTAATLAGAETLSNKTVTGPQATFTASAPANVPLVAKGAASQSANVFEVRNSTNAQLFNVSPGGSVNAFNAVTAPDLTATDDLTVGDSASVGGNLTVTGTITNDLAWDTSTTGWTIAAGWTLTSVGYRMFGPHVSLVWSATRTGATLTGTVSGNIVDTNIFSAIPALIRPTLDRRSSVFGNFNGYWYVTTAGAIVAAGLHESATIAASDAVNGSIDYLI